VAVISIPVRLRTCSYEVLVGKGVAKRLSELLPSETKKVAVVTQEGIDFEIDPGVPKERFVVPQGESAKSLSSVEGLCRAFARRGLARTDTVVAVGGGVVTDLAGFCAAVYLRGVRYVNVPTTLLAQVDAAIGGKTGVNIEEGKNLVGAFWQPAAVLCDTDALSTLPEREWASGRGEMAKCAFLGKLLRLTEENSSWSEDEPDTAWSGSSSDTGWPGEDSLEEQIARCVAIKVAAVTSDEREDGVRALLNYGHTLAHALEAASLSGDSSDLRHGEAVAVGIAFAARLARRLGRIDDEKVAYHDKVIESFGFDLPVKLPEATSSAVLVEFMARDKKARHDLTFVLDGPEGVEVVRGVPADEVVATLSEMGCRP
jgi:5-deoxy-5-amino-3-dehydroquinate synthase